MVWHRWTASGKGFFFLARCSSWKKPKTNKDQVPAAIVTSRQLTWKDESFYTRDVFGTTEGFCSPTLVTKFVVNRKTTHILLSRLGVIFQEEYKFFQQAHQTQFQRLGWDDPLSLIWRLFFFFYRVKWRHMNDEIREEDWWAVLSITALTLILASLLARLKRKSKWQKRNHTHTAFVL